MRKHFSRRYGWAPVMLGVAATLGVGPALGGRAGELDLPWRQAGLSERAAAAHLLDRFAFGARPGDVDRVVSTGLERWLERQLVASLSDPAVEQRLEGYRTLDMSASELRRTYPPPGRIVRLAERAGIVSRELLTRPDGAGSSRDSGRAGERRRQLRQLLDFAGSRGYRPLPELMDELNGQKLYRAVYSENQLREVLTDFWFNHFNVSVSDPDVRQYVLAYERDAIRPHVLGRFETMLVATAQHPAMLQYLDNAQSVAPDGTETLRRPALGPQGQRRRRAGGPLGQTPDDPERRRLIEERRPQGLNENYARELLELHTLGVDGGYTQTDVIEVARAFTGWTTYPEGARAEAIRARVSRLARGRSTRPFVFGEAFLFRADAHDAESKTILGRTYPAGGGLEEGLAVLGALSTHQATAKHLARKLAIRFVSDAPPSGLVDRLAARYLATGGDLKEVVRAIADAPEFWSAEARRSKIKSPFELAVSAARSLEADVEQPYVLAEWIEEMGQPLYGFPAPTGYPDRASAWLNAGSLVARMNFGLQLATRRVPGVTVDLAALGHGVEPESMTAALETYLEVLLPERETAATLSRLSAVLADPELATRVEEAARPGRATRAELDMLTPFDGRAEGRRAGRGAWYQRPAVSPVEPDSGPVAHVVGVILGSPEFQRR